MSLGIYCYKSFLKIRITLIEFVAKFRDRETQSFIACLCRSSIFIWYAGANELKVQQFNFLI